jgi:hypothetical protein
MPNLSNDAAMYTLGHAKCNTGACSAIGNKQTRCSKQTAAVVVDNADCSPFANVTQGAARSEQKSRAIDACN